MLLSTLPAAEIQEGSRYLLEADRRGLEAPDFGRWMTYARHDLPKYRWDYPHMRFMQEHFDRVTTGDVKRLMLEVSGRHGKTEHIKGYAAYLLERDPSTRILFGTYKQKQANTISRGVRRIVGERGVAINPRRDAVEEWETTSGGGFSAVGGQKTGVASVNADVILIDDPIGSRAEAESQAHRDAVWDWMTMDILARCEPHTRVVFSMPRWHVDDPAGRIHDQQSKRWTIVHMPGIAQENDQLGRAEGELLWTEERGPEWHEAMLAELMSYGYASFIQCSPSPREGGMFKWDWWQTLDQVPAVGRMVRYWDLAGTDVKSRSHDPDYSVGALLCRMQDKRTAIVDISRFRKSVHPRDVRVLEVCAEDLATYGSNRVKWWIETETGIAGQERTADLVRNIQALGMSVHTEHPTGSKVDRAEPLAGAAEAGNIVLCPGAWRDTFRAEMADFPNGRHDDQSDAAAGAFQKLAVRTATRIREFRI